MSRCLLEEFFLLPTEVEELLIDTLMKLLVEPTMELVPSLTAIPLRSPDIYDSLQIFLQKTGSQEISLLMVQSAVRSVFIMDDLHLFAIYDWLGLHPSQLVCHGSQFHLHHLGSTMTHQCWFLDHHIEDVWCGSTQLCLPSTYFYIH